MFSKVFFSFLFARFVLCFSSFFFKLSRNVLGYSLVGGLIIPVFSPAWGILHGDERESGGASVAITFPDVPSIPSQDLTRENLIGRGSFGNVYAGKWNGVEVAIKALHLQAFAPSLWRGFEEEVQVLWTCQFPRVVRLYGVCKEPGHYAMVFERMETSLYDLIHGNGPISEDRRLQIALDMAQGLKDLHTHPVVHQDFKSPNVLLNTRGRAKISDFGSAKIRTATSTQTGQARGTVRWMAPELFGLHPRATPASDMYSYGMVLWELLTGRIPFATQANELIIMGAIKEGQRETIPSTCPPLFREIIEACWKQDPQARPTAQEVLARFMAVRPPVPSLWLPEESPGPDYPLRTEGFALYPASQRDWNQVLTCYHHHPLPGYDVGRVEVVFNPAMNARFQAQRKLLQQRQGNPRYRPLWREKPDGDQRAKVLGDLDIAAEPYLDDDFPDVKHFPVWHGTSKANLPSLLSAGYGTFCDTDEGYFGMGIYATLEARYAQLYADNFRPSPSETGVLLLNWGITYSSYPILAQDFDSDRRRLRVKINQGRYDSHFVPVVPGDPTNLSVYVPPTSGQRKRFTEIVFGNVAQILPRFVITLQPSLPGEPKSQELILQARLKEKADQEQALRERAKRLAQREADARRQAQAQKEACHLAAQQARGAMVQHPSHHSLPQAAKAGSSTPPAQAISVLAAETVAPSSIQGDDRPASTTSQRVFGPRKPPRDRAGGYSGDGCCVYRLPNRAGGSSYVKLCNLL